MMCGGGKNSRRKNDGRGGGRGGGGQSERGKGRMGGKGGRTGQEANEHLSEQEGSVKTSIAPPSRREFAGTCSRVKPACRVI